MMRRRRTVTVAEAPSLQLGTQQPNTNTSYEVASVLTQNTCDRSRPPDATASESAHCKIITHNKLDFLFICMCG